MICLNIQFCHLSKYSIKKAVFHLGMFFKIFVSLSFSYRACFFRLILEALFIKKIKFNNNFSVSLETEKKYG